ncbi:hypothetical protein AC1031_021297 [Aphanomyces cochlioides]|nr:hypothetical protein AC1031_021297 [Aphanomyces cochlioides]
MMSAAPPLFSQDLSQFTKSEGGDVSFDVIAMKICAQLHVDPKMTLQEALSLHLQQLAKHHTLKDMTSDALAKYVQRGKVVEDVVSAVVARELVHEANPVVDLFAMDKFLARLTSLKEAFPPTWIHALAIKANPLSGILLEAKSLGVGLETASYAEAIHALDLGFLPRHVIVDSPCKTTADMEELLRLGCYLNLDNEDEIRKVDQLLGGSVPESTIGLRINPVVGGGTIAASSTATTTSKFGLAWTPDTDVALTKLFQDHPWLQGVHVHVGSQGCALSLLVAGAERAVAFAKQTNERLGRRQIRVIDIGGGVPTIYNGLDKEAVEFTEYAALLKQSVPELFTGEFQVMTEFGRSVFAKAGVTVTRVETVKQWNGQNIAVVHCGANQFLRPVYLPKTWPHCYSVFDSHGRLKQGNLVRQDIAGPLCFSGDVLARDVYLPQIEVGDYIVMHDTGAYNMAMYSKFNSIQAPEVIAYRQKGNAIQFSQVRPRESVAETLAFWGPKLPLAWS